MPGVKLKIQTTEKSYHHPNQIVSSKHTTRTKKSIEPAILKLAEHQSHIIPSIGMHLRCTIPRKSVPLNGTLKFLGHIPNLPKRNNLLVAGLEVESTEDLATDGTFFGKRYFTTPPKKAYFLPFKSCKIG